MGRPRKTRFERLIGSRDPKSKPAATIERVRNRGTKLDWEQKARSIAAYPFEVEIVEVIVPEEPDEPEDEVLESDREAPPPPPPPPTRY